VEVRLGHEVTAARAVPGGLRLDVTDGTGSLATLETEHVIAATGFKATADRLGLLSADLRAALARSADGSPEVGRDFESPSHPGLFLAGLATASGYGPAMRFVHGATYTASALVRGVRRRLRTGPVLIPAPTRHETPETARR
jgi:lysine/ornithine N-monooxygenase